GSGQVMHATQMREDSRPTHRVSSSIDIGYALLPTVGFSNVPQGQSMSILVQRSPAGNSLIAALPRADRVRVVDACEPARLAFGAPGYAAGDPIPHVYFPTSGYVSLITPPVAAESLEVGMVGTE